MRRLSGLLLKELSQHGWVVALLAVFIGGVQGLLVLGTAVAPRTITMLEVHESFMRVFLPLIGLALGRRLVVREYYAHTQRFLESLPLHRWEVFLTKLLVGAVLVCGAAFASFVVASLVAAFKEPLGGRWLLIVLWRTEVFALCVWALFFTMGLLGRWRIPAYLALGLLLLWLDRATEVSLTRMAPLSLINDTFVLERHDLPVGDLALSLLVAAVAIGVGALLALSRDGAIADSFAEAMSRREKVAVGVVLSLSLIGSSVTDPLTEEEPFAFEQEQVVRRADVGLAVLYLDPSHRAEAEALADRLALDLAALREALDLSALPPVHVALRPDLPVHRYEDVPLAEEDPGILLRARFHDEAFDRGRFSQRVLERAIVRATDGRADHESIAWVRSGLAGAIARPGTARLAAYYATRRRPRYDTLDRWRLTEEAFGADVARALATSAARAVIEETSEERWRAFARSVLEEEPPRGLLAAIDLRADPVRARFTSETGLAVEAFETAWGARLREARARIGDLPRADATAEVEREEGALRTIAWGVDFPEGPPPGAFCALVHAPLGPFDQVLEPADLLREERPCDDLEGARLLGRYSAGERVFYAVEVEALDAQLRLLSVRGTLP